MQSPRVCCLVKNARSNFRMDRSDKSKQDSGSPKFQSPAAEHHLCRSLYRLVSSTFYQRDHSLLFGLAFHLVRFGSRKSSFVCFRLVPTTLPSLPDHPPPLVRSWHESENAGKRQKEDLDLNTGKKEVWQRCFLVNVHVPFRAAVIDKSLWIRRDAILSTHQ